MYPIPAVFFLCLSMICVLAFVFQSLYADALQIYLSRDRKDLDVMISALNEDLAAISRFDSAENGLLLDPRNSQAILISNSAVGMVLSSLFLSTEEIPWCDAVTDLVVIIDGCLRFDRQVTKVCSRVCATYRRDCV
jgi:hypothetical protein